MTDPRTTPGADAPGPNDLDAGDPDTGSDDLAVDAPTEADSELRRVVDDVKAHGEG